MKTYFIRLHCAWHRVTTSEAIWASLPHVTLGVSCAVALVGGGVVLGPLVVPPAHVDVVPYQIAPSHAVGGHGGRTANAGAQANDKDVAVSASLAPIAPRAPGLVPLGITQSPLPPATVWQIESPLIPSETVPVPEPSSAAVLGVGVVGLLLVRGIRK